MKLPVYFDYHSTTPVDPRVLETMLPFFTEAFGNAASALHPFGWHAAKAVETSRRQIAAMIGAQEKEIFFTSGTTESANLAINGAKDIYGEEKDHIITQITEHKAVLNSCRALEEKGMRVTYLKVDERGRISLKELEEALTDKTLMVSIMHANNEIGTVHPIEQIGRLTRAKGILFHVDAAQTAGKLPLNVEKMNIDLLSFSAHKMYGPKGIGAIYIRSQNPRVRINPQILGGGHEEGIRSGTLNVPAIVGFGKACDIAVQEMKSEGERIRGLRDRMQAAFCSRLDHVYVQGDPERRLPNNLSVSFAYVEAEPLLMTINSEVAVSSGSACTSGKTQISHVLRALGLKPELLTAAIRFGLGRFNTEEEVDYAVEKIVAAVQKLRCLSPFYPGKSS